MGISLSWRTGADSVLMSKSSKIMILHLGDQVKLDHEVMLRFLSA
jgi:hypothetical protein